MSGEGKGRERSREGSMETKREGGKEEEVSDQLLSTSLVWDLCVTQLCYISELYIHINISNLCDSINVQLDNNVGEAISYICSSNCSIIGTDCSDDDKPPGH